MESPENATPESGDSSDARASVDLEARRRLLRALASTPVILTITSGVAQAQVASGPYGGGESEPDGGGLEAPLGQRRRRRGPRWWEPPSEGSSEE